MNPNNVKMRRPGHPGGISWANAPRGTAPPNTKLSAATHIYQTHAATNYNRTNPQTAEEFRQGREAVAYNKYINSQLAKAMGSMSLSGGGRKTKQRTSHRKHRTLRNRRYSHKI